MHGPYPVIFAAGLTSTEFYISIIDDDVYENNETFKLAINSLFLPHNVSTVDPTNQTTVIIKNDDSKWFVKLHFAI